MLCLQSFHQLHFCSDCYWQIKTCRICRMSWLPSGRTWDRRLHFCIKKTLIWSWRWWSWKAGFHNHQKPFKQVNTNYLLKEDQIARLYIFESKTKPNGSRSLKRTVCFTDLIHNATIEERVTVLEAQVGGKTMASYSFLSLLGSMQMLHNILFRWLKCRMTWLK